MFPAPEDSAKLCRLLASKLSYDARAVVAHTLYEHGQVTTKRGHDDDAKRSAEIVWLADQFVEALGGPDFYERTASELGL